MEDGRCGGRVVLPLGTLSLLETVAAKGQPLSFLIT